MTTSESDIQRRVEAFERDLEFCEFLRETTTEDIAALIDLSRAYYLEPACDRRTK